MKTVEEIKQRMEELKMALWAGSMRTVTFAQLACPKHTAYRKRKMQEEEGMVRELEELHQQLLSVSKGTWCREE